MDKTENDLLKGYQGIFFSEEVQKKLVKLQKRGLDSIIKDMHITFKYGELEKFPDELMNKEIMVKIIGYASDGKNSGFQVELPEELKKYYKNVNGAHITVSLGEVDGIKGKAVDTGVMEFEPIDPVEISGQLGYFVYKKDRSKSEKIMDNSLFGKEYEKNDFKATNVREGEIQAVLNETIEKQKEISNPEQAKEEHIQSDN